MKKYISILSLITAVVLQSCERSDLNIDSENEILPKTTNTSEKIYSRSENDTTPENPSSNNIETGDDDEPRKDKSHWRIQNDSIK
ncbi:hypothetical protein HZQ13_05585 [Elizabethkingia anophelis]|nr:hypothetical protein [Elizabethkingia anophelis]